MEAIERMEDLVRRHCGTRDAEGHLHILADDTRAEDLEIRVLLHRAQLTSHVVLCKEVHVSAFFVALSLAVIDFVMGHVNSTWTVSCYAPLCVSSGEPTLAAHVGQGASRMRLNYGDAAAHHSTHNTQDHTHMQTNINNRHTNKATHHKTTHAPAAAWRRAATAFCVAPLSRMPDRQAAQATGSVLPAQDTPRRAVLRGPRKARANWRAGVAARNYITVTLQYACTNKKSLTHAYT